MDKNDDIIIIICDTNFHVKYINPSGLTFFEYGSLNEIKNELVTKIIIEVSAHYHKEIFKEIAKRRYDMSITRCIANNEPIREMIENNMNAIINKDNISNILEQLTHSSPKQVLTKNKQVKEVLMYINLTTERNSIIYMLPTYIAPSSITNEVTTGDKHKVHSQEYNRQRKLGNLSKTLIKLKSI